MGARSRRKKGRRNTRINAAIADPDDSFAGAAALDRATIDEGSPEESGSLGEVPSSFADGPADGPPPDDELRAKPRTEPRDAGAGEGQAKGERRAPPPLPTRSSVAPTLREPPKPIRPAASDDVTLVGPPPPPPPPKRSTLGDFPTSFAPGLDDERDALAQTLVDDEPRTRAGSAPAAAAAPPADAPRSSVVDQLGETRAPADARGLAETRAALSSEARAVTVPGNAELGETRVRGSSSAATTSSGRVVTREWAPVPGPILDDDDDDASEAGGLGGRSPSELAETQLSGPGSTLVSGQIPGSQPPLAGRFGRFVLLRRLGGGGMGTVYAAFDEELARRVAIKVLHREACLPPLLLRAEAQAMARLSHPNVVQVYELGEQQGQLFLVMEYVEGETLGEWLELAETRPWTAVLELFIAAGEGLAAAHRAGLVHRDFKPDNVLVDKEGVPRVADFGLARPSAEGVQQIAGTPAFMAPEQHLGAPTDARSDIFAFAVALYGALLGEPPFAGESYEELRDAVVRGEVRPAPARSPVPARLRAVLVKAMAVDPAERTQTMDALLGELRSFVPRGGSRWPARAAWVGALGLTGVVVAQVVGGVAGPTPAQLASVAQGAALAGACGERAEWVYPSSADAPEVSSIRQVMALERLEGPAGDFARRQTQRLRGDFAAALDRLGDHYWEDPKTRAFARDFYAQALIFAPDDEVALARGNFTIGALAQLREQAESSGFSSAEIEAAAPLKILADLDDPDLAAKIAALLDACAPPDEGALAAAGSGAGASEVSPVAALGEPASAEAAPEVAPEPEPEPAPPASDEAPELAPAVAPAEAPPPSSAPEPAAKKRRSIDTEGLIARAESARRRGQDAEASRLFEQALTLAPRNPTALAALSDIAFDRGDFAEAAKLARKAIQVAPEIAEYHTRLGDALVKLRRKGEGLAAYERGLELGDARAKRRIELLEKGKL